MNQQYVHYNTAICNKHRSVWGSASLFCLLSLAVLAVPLRDSAGEDVCERHTKRHRADVTVLSRTGKKVTHHMTYYTIKIYYIQ